MVNTPASPPYAPASPPYAPASPPYAPASPPPVRITWSLLKRKAAQRERSAKRMKVKAEKRKAELARWWLRVPKFKVPQDLERLPLRYVKRMLTTTRKASDARAHLTGNFSGGWDAEYWDRPCREGRFERIRMLLSSIKLSEDHINGVVADDVSF